MDVEEIPPGVRFADYIHEAVGSCDVRLALIGPSWLSVTKGDGSLRLDDDHDFVRLEIAAALERGVRVVPTLADGATMLRSGALPGVLKNKLWGQGVQTSPDGSKIIGGFVANKIDGDVVLVSEDGRRSSAHFVAGVRDR